MEVALNYIIFAVFCIALSCMSCTTNTRTPQPRPIQAVGDIANTGSVKPGREEEEAVLTEVLKIRGRKLEKASGISFGKTWVIRADLEYSVGDGYRGQVDAQYVAEGQMVVFPIRKTYELNVKYKTPVRLLDPVLIADDPEFGALVDHELGHALSDIISRRAGLGPFFTVEQFNKLSRDRGMGVNITAEGIGMYFQRLLHPVDETLSPLAFPASVEQDSQYTYEIVVFQGGAWLMKDIIAKYGERGIVWVLAHPLVAPTDNMRSVAEAYRSKALTELARQ